MGGDERGECIVWAFLKISEEFVEERYIVEEEDVREQGLEREQRSVRWPVALDNLWLLTQGTETAAAEQRAPATIKHLVVDIGCAADADSKVVLGLVDTDEGFFLGWEGDGGEAVEREGLVEESERVAETAAVRHEDIGHVQLVGVLVSHDEWTADNLGEEEVARTAETPVQERPAPLALEYREHGFEEVSYTLETEESTVCFELHNKPDLEWYNTIPRRVCCFHSAGRHNKHEIGSVVSWRVRDWIDKTRLGDADEIFLRTVVYSCHEEG